MFISVHVFVIECRAVCIKVGMQRGLVGTLQSLISSDGMKRDFSAGKCLFFHSNEFFRLVSSLDCLLLLGQFLCAKLVHLCE